MKAKILVFGIVMLMLTSSLVLAYKPYEFYLEDDVADVLEGEYGFDSCWIEEGSHEDDIYCDGYFLGEFEHGYEENEIFDESGDSVASYDMEDQGSYIKYSMYSNSGKRKFSIKAYGDGDDRYYDADGDSIREGEFWNLWDDYVLYVAQRLADNYE